MLLILHTEYYAVDKIVFVDIQNVFIELAGAVGTKYIVSTACENFVAHPVVKTNCRVKSGV